MKINLYYYTDCGPGHIALEAYDTAAKKSYWINFTDHLPPNYEMPEYVQYTDKITFNSGKNINELIKWHKDSNFYDPDTHCLCTNNCADAVRTALENFFGLDLETSRCTWTRLCCCFWVPTHLDTPRSIFNAAKQTIKQEGNLSSEEDSLLISTSVSAGL